MAHVNNLKLIAQGNNMPVLNPYENMNISKYVVAAICGCWWRESNCNPAIWESLIPCAWDFEYDYTNKGGYGLGQWTNVGSQHGRLWDLHEWCTNNGYTDGDGNAELIYVYVENFWNTSNPSRLGYNTLAEFLESTSTVLDDLVYDFLSRWEGVPNDHYSQRCQYARQILDYIDAHMYDSTSWQWISGNRYLTNNEIYNNAMVIFTFMSHGTQTGNYIRVSSTGNGTAHVDNPQPADGENFTLYAIPASGETLEDITARDSHGYSIAMMVTQVYTYTYNETSWGNRIDISVEFSGTTPPPPPTPQTIKFDHHMPIWMYPFMRC